MNFDNLCINCMKIKHRRMEVCPYCGFNPVTYQNVPEALSPFTILNGKYILGKVLGRGGFGITYLAFDGILNQTVAIKEFFPSGLVSRCGDTVSASIDTNRKTFRTGLESFVSEGRKLFSFSHTPRIVDFRDCFMENGTGYLVMEYLVGKTLRQELEQCGRIPWQKAEKMIIQVLEGLDAVHQANLIHRDIAPDNIFLLQDGTVKLLDFGAARYAVTGRTTSMSVILKRGYAPIEQYGSSGKQGTWTDMYGVGATFYRMITGREPTEVTDRSMGVSLPTPSSLGISIPREKERILMKSLELRSENRIQSAREYIELLEERQTLSQDLNRVQIRETPKPKPASWPKWAVGGAAAVFLAAAGFGIYRTVAPGSDAGEKNQTMVFSNNDETVSETMIQEIGSAIAVASASSPSELAQRLMEGTVAAEDCFPAVIEEIGENQILLCAAAEEDALNDQISVVFSADYYASSDVTAAAERTGTAGEGYVELTVDTESIPDYIVTQLISCEIVGMESGAYEKPVAVSHKGVFPLFCDVELQAYSDEKSGQWTIEKIRTETHIRHGIVLNGAGEVLGVLDEMEEQEDGSVGIVREIQ